MADSRVALTANQFQQRIPKVRDVRATVVGRRVFAANILADTAGGLLEIAVGTRPYGRPLPRSCSTGAPTTPH